MKENIIKNKSFAFAIRVVKSVLGKSSPAREYILVKASKIPEKF